ncbi:MAG: hypothetical protein ACOX0L_07750 [Natronincolaceae bacterium]|jgi:hypothetical protein|nr:hypothetical protein [Bacillota bacterium]
MILKLIGLNYSDALDDFEYSKAIIKGCKDAGIIGFTGDGVKDEFYDLPLRAIGEYGGGAEGVKIYTERAGAVSEKKR